jgi:hypothetical protein
MYYLPRRAYCLIAKLLIGYRQCRGCEMIEMSANLSMLQVLSVNWQRGLLPDFFERGLLS